MKYLNLKYFLIAFGLGLFFVYSFGDVPKIVFKYPTPDNIDETQYKDSANNCYKYEANEIKCPKNKKKITNIPIMHKCYKFQTKQIKCDKNKEIIDSI
jgi:hypothetical protein